MKFKLMVIDGGGECARALESFERHVASVLDPFDFGRSVHGFELCLELSHRLSRVDWYAALRRHAAYRGRDRCLLSVAVLDAGMRETHLHEALADALVDAAHLAEQAVRRLPRDFPARRFGRCVRDAARAWPESVRLARSE